MAEGKIIRLGGGSPLVIDGEEVVSGEYQDTINQFDAVFATSDIDFEEFFQLLEFSAYATNADFSPDDIFLVTGTIQAPRFRIYKRENDSVIKQSNPSVLPPGNVYDIRFSGNGEYVALAMETTPFLFIYKKQGDSFTKLADPSDLSTNRRFAVIFSNNSDYLVTGGERQNVEESNLMFYKRSGDTFTKLADPAGVPGLVLNNRCMTFSPNDEYFIVAAPTGSFGLNTVNIFQRTGDVFSLTNNSFRIVDVSPRVATFSPNGEYVVIGSISTVGGNPIMSLYKHSNGTLTLSDTIALPGQPHAAEFTADSQVLILTHRISPGRMVCRIKNDTLTILETSLPTGFSLGLALAVDSLDNLAIGFPTASASAFSHLEFFDKSFKTKIFSNITNNLTLAADHLGYALEDGTAGQTKTMMSLFAQLTDQPIEFLLTTAPTGQLSSPPPVFLRVGFVNPTNQTVQVEALLFRADTPETLLGVNLLPTTLAPGESFGPSDVATAGGNSGLHTLTLRMKEAGKAFSAIVEVSVDIVGV